MSAIVISVAPEVSARLDRLSARLKRPRSEVFTLLVLAATEDDDGSSGAPANPIPEPIFREARL